MLDATGVDGYVVWVVLCILALPRRGRPRTTIAMPWSPHGAGGAGGSSGNTRVGASRSHRVPWGGPLGWTSGGLVGSCSLITPHTMSHAASPSSWSGRSFHGAITFGPKKGRAERPVLYSNPMPPATYLAAIDLAKLRGTPGARDPCLDMRPDSTPLPRSMAAMTCLQ